MNSTLPQELGAVTKSMAGDSTSLLRSNWWLPLAIAVLALAVSLVAATKLWTAPSAQRFGTVDLASVIEAKQSQFASMIAKPGATDADRAVAMELVKAMAPKLEQTLIATQAECQCILLVKGAVVSAKGLDVPDYTASLKMRLDN